MRWAIQTEDLTKRYGDHLVVDHICFQVNEGEIFGFLGPNGSGKTSTICIFLILFLWPAIHLLHRRFG